MTLSVRCRLNVVRLSRCARGSVVSADQRVVTVIAVESMMTFSSLMNWPHALRGISFASAVDFDWSRTLVFEDKRRDDGEPRYRALGLLAGRLHMLVFTPREERAHVISLRKANKREIRRYASKAQKESGTNGS